MESTDLFREVTPLSNEDCFVIFNRTKSFFSFPVHVHPEFELNFIENAKGAERIVGDSIEEIDDLELCLIGNDKLEHGWMTANCKSENIHEITIQFHSNLFIESLLNKTQFRTLLIMFVNAKKGIVFSREKILEVRHKIYKLTKSQNEFKSVIELIEILYDLSLDKNPHLLSNSSFTNDNESSESRRVQKIIAYLDANYKNDVHLSEVAKYIGMSEVSLSRFMKMRTGKNFIEYFNDLRLGIATRLLVNSNKTIAEITFECGFNNLSNFHRLFKKKKNCTPNEFRENYSKMRRFV